MKKFFALFITLFSVSIILVACGQKNSSVKYYDSAFITDLEKGLENRWALSDSDPENESKDFYTKLDNKELDQISKYTNKKFKNSNLQEHAIAYINTLKKQKATLKYYGSESFDEKWIDATNNRNAEFLSINKIQKIKVADKYKDYLAELMGSGKAQTEENELDKKVNILVKGINFKTQPKEYVDDTYTDYEAIVKNTTGKDIKNFGIVIKIKDKDDTTVDTQYANTEEWDKGDRVKLKFSTDAEVNKMKITKDYVEFSK